MGAKPPSRVRIPLSPPRYVSCWSKREKAIGISATSTAPLLKIPKSIFRMTADDNYILEAIYEKLYSSQMVYYIYSDLQIATLNVLKILENDSNINNLKTFSVSDTNLTLDNLKPICINCYNKMGSTNWNDFIANCKKEYKTSKKVVKTQLNVV